MNEIMHMLLENLSAWLEPIGIIAGLFFSGIALRNDTRARRIETPQHLVGKHRRRLGGWVQGVRNHGPK